VAIDLTGLLCTYPPFTTPPPPPLNDVYYTTLTHQTQCHATEQIVGFLVIPKSDGQSLTDEWVGKPRLKIERRGGRGGVFMPGAVLARQ